jgi:hypothetical protein
MPLVKDGIASEDSRLAVEEHVKECEECKMLYASEKTELVEINPDLEMELGKLKRKLQIFSTVLMMFGVFFGLSLTASEEMFYNSLIMPVIGGLGYVIFRWKAVYQVPLLLLVMLLIINFLGIGRGMEIMPVMGVVMWVGIYTVFVELGVLVAGLLHFVFRKER